MEALMGKDLDQLTEVITGTLQEMHKDRPVVGAQPGSGATVSGGDKEGNREPLAAMQLKQDQDLKSDKGQDLNQKDTLRMKQQGVCFSSVEKREYMLAYEAVWIYKCFNNALFLWST